MTVRHASTYHWVVDRWTATPQGWRSESLSAFDNYLRDSDQVETHREVRFWFDLSYDATKLHGQMLRMKFCYFLFVFCRKVLPWVLVYKMAGPKGYGVLWRRHDMSLTPKYIFLAFGHGCNYFLLQHCHYSTVDFKIARYFGEERIFLSTQWCLGSFKYHYSCKAFMKIYCHSFVFIFAK